MPSFWRKPVEVEAVRVGLKEPCGPPSPASTEFGQWLVKEDGEELLLEDEEFRRKYLPGDIAALDALSNMVAPSAQECAEQGDLETVRVFYAELFKYLGSVSGSLPWDVATMLGRDIETVQTEVGEYVKSAERFLEGYPSNPIEFLRRGMPVREDIAQCDEPPPPKPEPPPNRVLKEGAQPEKPVEREAEERPERPDLPDRLQAIDRILEHLGDFAYYDRSDDPDEERSRGDVVTLVLEALDEAGMVVSDKDGGTRSFSPSPGDADLIDEAHGRETVLIEQLAAWEHVDWMDRRLENGYHHPSVCDAVPASQHLKEPHCPKCEETMVQYRQLPDEQKEPYRVQVRNNLVTLRQRGCAVRLIPRKKKMSDLSGSKDPEAASQKLEQDCVVKKGDGCRSCGFACWLTPRIGEGGSRMYCAKRVNEAGEAREIPWDPDVGMLRPIPSWCPLHEGPITQRLEKGS